MILVMVFDKIEYIISYVREIIMNIDQERKTSAITLSDMEVFIFPELIYSLVLANIISPCIWKWREDPWFKGIEDMKPYRRLTRLKQYIMDHYVFNLDLDTWGLTTKTKEIARFKSFIDSDTLKESNALFGYEGDKYYFDIDIRRHFGLDKYEGDVIPYWKTETVEAMNAFRYKENYSNGAGECVSLAVLYAAAVFIVARIPLEDIYLMATPLHSQNFIDINKGVLTNNRRLVTKKMWVNGTELSAKSRRALENERVTIVAHQTGWIHTVFKEANIGRGYYDNFAKKIKVFLKSDLTSELLGNFLRYSQDIRKCFQLKWPRHGIDHYIGLERAFCYEGGAPYLLTDNTRKKLMAEIDVDEFYPFRMPGRIVLNELEQYITHHKINIDNQDDVDQLKIKFASDCLNAEAAIESLLKFCQVKPKLPQLKNKKFVPDPNPLNIDLNMQRDDIIQYLESRRKDNIMADMCFHAYHDLNRIEADPFVQAAVGRNPVSISATEGMTDQQVIEMVKAFPKESIYEGQGRLAQPDEVWNFKRGDGLEKALLLANILSKRCSGKQRENKNIKIEISPDKAVLKLGTDSKKIVFTSSKGLKKQIWSI